MNVSKQIKEILDRLRSIERKLVNPKEQYEGCSFTGDVYEVDMYRKGYENPFYCQERSCPNFDSNNTQHNCVMYDPRDTAPFDYCSDKVTWTEDPSPYRCVNSICNKHQKGWANNCMEHKLNWGDVLHCKFRICRSPKR